MAACVWVLVSEQVCQWVRVCVWASVCVCWVGWGGGGVEAVRYFCSIPASTPEGLSRLGYVKIEKNTGQSETFLFSSSVYTLRCHRSAYPQVCHNRLGDVKIGREKQQPTGWLFSPRSFCFVLFQRLHLEVSRNKCGKKGNAPGKGISFFPLTVCVGTWCKSLQGKFWWSLGDENVAS